MLSAILNYRCECMQSSTGVRLLPIQGGQPKPGYIQNKSLWGLYCGGGERVLKNGRDCLAKERHCCAVDLPWHRRIWIRNFNLNQSTTDST